MYLAGRIKFDEEDYFLCWKDIKSAECFWVFSPYHKDDALNVAMGNPATQEVISSEFRLASFYNENYVLEIMKRLWCPDMGTTTDFGYSFRYYYVCKKL